jgi:hypothetical protein
VTKVVEEIYLTLEEKNLSLDKILLFLKRNALENIGCETVDGIEHYSASFVDQSGVGFSFVCSAYKDNGPERGGLGIRMVDIAISWGGYVTAFESGGGEVYNKIKSLIGELRIIYRRQV